jgi:hypothetical protein
MDEIQLPTNELARLLVRHGEEFVCCKELMGISPLEAGVPDRRIPSSGVALRKQIESGDFRVSISLERHAKLANEKSMWLVALQAKFGARSPGGAIL